MEPRIAVFGILRFPPERIADVLPHLKVLVTETYKMTAALPMMLPRTPSILV